MGLAAFTPYLDLILFPALAVLIVVTWLAYRRQVANIWCPYLTIAEGIKLAAQSFTMEVAKLSCCAA